MSNLTRLVTQVRFVSEPILTKAIEAAGYSSKKIRTGEETTAIEVYDGNRYIFTFYKTRICEQEQFITSDVPTYMATAAQKTLDRISVEYQKEVMLDFYRRKGYIKAIEKKEESKTKVVLRRY